MTDREYVCSRVKELGDEYITRLRVILENMLGTDAKDPITCDVCRLKTEFVEVADIEEAERWCANCCYSGLGVGCPKRCSFGDVQGIWVEEGKGES